MKKATYMFLGFIAAAVGINLFGKSMKTDFHKNLEKHITVKAAEHLLASECGQKPGGGGDPVPNRTA